ncbi:MAG TPA: hypothetical protein VK603_10165, partial [Candidatus Saccharimonadales bacterium]|nr:hypothetical protein [Candidatus Saccharimonadales bacterium]
MMRRAARRLRAVINGSRHRRQADHVLGSPEVAPAVRLGGVDVGEAVDGGELPAGDDLTRPARNLGVR